MGIEYRSEHYKFFHKGSELIGVSAYRYSPMWDIIQDYLIQHDKYDEMYGVCGLVNLVDDDMAKRFDTAIMKFAITIKRTDDHNWKQNRKELQMRAEICKRGLEAMRSFVEKNNLYKPPEVWIGKSGDRNIGIIKEEDKLLYAKHMMKDVDCFYTMSEIMVMVRDYDMTTAIKKQLEKSDIEAKVVDVQPKQNEELFDDEIPF